MKQPRRLTRMEKIRLSALGYEPRLYACVGVEKNVITLQHKVSGRVIDVELW